MVKQLLILLLAALPAVAQPYAQILKLPVWLDADEWARQQELEYWRLFGDEMSDLYLIAEAGPEKSAALRRQCGNDIECVRESCQSVRTVANNGYWLAAAPPPLAVALDGMRWQCEVPGNLQWTGDAHLEGRCWRVVRGDGCEVEVTSLAAVQPEYRRDRLVVLFGAGRAELERQLDSARERLEQWHSLQSLNLALAVIAVDPGHLEQAGERWRQLAVNGAVQWEHRLISQLYRGGNDQSFRSLPMMDVAARSSEGLSLKIALVDSGVEAQAGIELVRADFTGTGYQPAVTGSALAAVMRQRAPLLLNSYQACTAWDGYLLVSDCWSSAVVRALDQALLDGSQVVLLGPTGPEGAVLSAMIDEAERRGVIVLSGAGELERRMPSDGLAGLRGVWAITAHDGVGRRYRHAAKGDFIELAAEGVNLSVRRAGQGGMQLSGTALAAAEVAVFLAQVRALHPARTPAELRQIVRDAADDLGAPGPDSAFGAGGFNPCRTLRMLDPGTDRCHGQWGGR